MRPGKPLMFGRIGDMPMLGMPGNPVSSIVCGLLFAQPAIRALLGLAQPLPPHGRAVLGRDLKQNDRREDYLRSTLDRRDGAEPLATPFERQDSSMLSRLAAADCLVIRPPHAPHAQAGDPVTIIDLAEVE
jgi:molybdopterin molybdotransferase